jgi:hypothetical protein
LYRDAHQAASAFTNSAAQLILRVRWGHDVDPVQAPQRQSNLVGECRCAARLGANEIEGNYGNRRPLERGRENRLSSAGRTADASRSPCCRRWAFAVPTPVLRRKAAEMGEAATRRNFGDARPLWAAQ